jgi:hypothetical protein
MSQSSNIGFGQTAAVALGAGGGAAIGQAVAPNSKYSAPIGAAVGTAATALVSNAVTTQIDQARAEGYAAGQRDERVKVYDAYWKSQFAQAQDSGNGGKAASGVVPVNYPVGVYDGTNYYTRAIPEQVTPATSVAEPTR